MHAARQEASMNTHISARRSLIVLAVLLLRPLTASAAPVLLGDSVHAEIYSDYVYDNDPESVTQFTSPAVVGDGVEFTEGSIRTGYRSAWNMAVDIGASSIIIRFGSLGMYDMTSNDGVVLGLLLTGLDFTPAGTITGVTRTGYSCVDGWGYACARDPGPDDPILSFTGNSINLGFGTVRDGETYRFDIAVGEPTPTPVPEPGTLALLGTGFVTFIANRNRRRRA
jgi:hypothetical protein